MNTQYSFVFTDETTRRRLLQVDIVYPSQYQFQNWRALLLTDEGDVCGLAVVDPLLGVDPQPGKFGENIDGFERLQVVDEDIGDP